MMDKHIQALELCMAARVAYNGIRMCLKEQYGAPLLPRAVEAIEEPFKTLKMSPMQRRVLIDKCLRIERGKYADIVRKQRPLVIAHMTSQFLNVLQSKYIEIPEGSALWDSVQGFFEAIERDIITDAENMKASNDAKRLTLDLLTYFQSKRLYLES